MTPDGVFTCGATNPTYPGEYACTLPAGHEPVEMEGTMFEHAAPGVGAYWNLPRQDAAPDDAARAEGYATVSEAAAYVQGRADERARIAAQRDKVAEAMDDHDSFAATEDGAECDCGAVLTESVEAYAVTAWREHRTDAVLAALGVTRG